MLLSRLNADKLLQYFYGIAGMGMFAVSTHASPTPAGYVMEIQLVPAVCSLDPQRNKKRKCLEGYSLNVVGLYPEVTSQHNCVSSTALTLPPIQAKVVARVMPDENARKQLWHSIGGCVPMAANQYFRMMINYAEKLKIPDELTSQETRVIQASVLRNRMLRLNPGLPTQGFEFSCQQNKTNSILTEIKICYQSNGRYKACPKNVQNNCPATFTIKGSF
ncbi:MULTISPECIES: ribonuclease I [Acinetobacter]|nr:MULTISPECIES: ribonuclease I [Acinetobacter]